MLEAGKIGTQRDPSDFDKGQLYWLDDLVRAFPKRQVLWGVPIQWLLSTKGGPGKDN